MPKQLRRDKTKSFFLDRKKEILLAVKEAEENKPLFEFEKYADGFALSAIKEYGYSVDGNFSFIKYCYYKQAEINNVRIVLSGLLNGVSCDEIKRRLRNTYEG